MIHFPWHASERKLSSLAVTMICGSTGLCSHIHILDVYVVMLIIYFFINTSWMYVQYWLFSHNQVTEDHPQAPINCSHLKSASRRTGGMAQASTWKSCLLHHNLIDSPRLWEACLYVGQWLAAVHLDYHKSVLSSFPR